MSKVFFQIGTNDGNDKFKRLVIQNKPDLVILVEPNESLISEIKKNYNGINNVFIYNNAVYYKNDESVELYIPSKNGILGNKADNGITYSHAQFSLVPMNDWGTKEDMAKIQAKGITFDKICENHNISTIEYLQIDTEGFDSEIIKMIDLSKYKIKLLRFEKWGFNKDCFTKYNGEKSDELGENGIREAIDKLIKYNYTIRDIIDEDGQDLIAILVQ